MKRAICAAVAVLAVLVASPGPATAVHVQSGVCQFLNEPFWDGDYLNANIGSTFFAGEHISMTATGSVRAPTTVLLEVPIGTVVDTEPFPGTVTYTFPADTLTTVAWRVLPPDTPVTWTVSCQGAVHDGYPLAVSTAQPATEIAAPAAAVVVESSERTDFPLAAVGVGALAVLVQIGLWRGATRHRRLPG